LSGGKWGTHAALLRSAVLTRLYFIPLGFALLTPTYAFRDQMKTDRCFNDLSPATEPPVTDLIPVL
jgi:hypothetical protein